MSNHVLGKVMASVDEIVQQFKKKASMTVWTGPKRTIDDVFDVAETERARKVHHMLSAAVSDARAEANRLRNHLELYTCTTASISQNSMRHMIEHVKTSASSSNGQWALLLKKFAFKGFYEDSVDKGNTQVPLYVSDGREEGDEFRKLRQFQTFEENLPNLVEGAKRALLDLGFLKNNLKTIDDYAQPSSTPMYQTDDEEEEEIDDEEEPPQSLEPEQTIEEEDQEDQEEKEGGIATYESLFERAIKTIPDEPASAMRQLNTEEHSMFAHAYDYIIENPNEGGGQPLPYERSYFYRSAVYVDDGFLVTSPANRNADLAAAFRCLILMSFVLAEDAKLDNDCKISYKLHAHPTSDNRYKGLVLFLREIHEFILSTDGDLTTTDIFDRLDRRNLFQRRAREIEAKIEALPSHGETRAPLVDLLLNIGVFMLKCMGSRYASGLSSPGRIPVKVYPSPTFKLDEEHGSAPESFEVNEQFDESHSQTSEVDSQATEVDD